MKINFVDVRRQEYEAMAFAESGVHLEFHEKVKVFKNFIYPTSLNKYSVAFNPRQVLDSVFNMLVVHRVRVFS